MGDEGFNQYPGQPLIGAAAQAAPPEPWSQHDTLTMERLQGAWKDLGDQVRDGILSPDEPTTLEARRDIGGQLQELTARQQAAENQAKQQQMQEALHQNAIQRVVAQQDAEHMAGNFHKTVGSFTDPQTGKTVHFAPKDAQQIDFGDTDQVPSETVPTSVEAPTDRQAAADPKLEAWLSAVGREPTPQELQSGAVDEYYQRHQSPEAQATRARWAAEGVPAQDARDVLSGKAPLQQRVMNADGGSSVVTYQQGPQGLTATGKQDFDASGKLIEPKGPSDQPANEDGTLSDAQRQDIQQKAQKLIGPPPPQTDRFGRPNPQFTEYMKRVDGQARRMETEQTSRNLVKLKNQLLTDREAHKEEVRKASKPALHDLAKQFDFTPHDTMKMLKEGEAEVAKDESTTPGPVLNPADGGHYAGPWSKAPKAIQEVEAERRITARLRRMKGGASHPDQPEETPAPAAQPPAQQGGQAPQPQGEFTKDDAGELAKLMERKKQLEQQRAQPSALGRVLSPNPSPGYERRVK